MKREEIEAGIARLKPWYQDIELLPGLSTKPDADSGGLPDHPRAEWEEIGKVLPRDLKGKRLLDVGCNGGFFAVEAKRRGASYVLGLDSQRHHVRQATFVASALGLEIDFRRMSVYDLDPNALGRFDVTLALGLLYHCKHLVLALEKLHSVTGELLIVESALLPTPAPPGWVKRALAPFTQDAARGRPTHLIGYVENLPDAKEAVFNWFLPSIDGLSALLVNAGFEVVSAKPYQTDRAIFVCRRRQAESDSRTLGGLAARLTLIAGPTACAPGAELRFRLTAANVGLAKWLALGEAHTAKGAVRLGAHLFTDDGREIVWYQGHVVLPRDVAPGESVELEITLEAPRELGGYKLEFDMVSEHLTWFEDLGSPTLQHRLIVSPSEQ